MENINDGFAHFGVKGMQWGVRRNREAVGGKATNSNVHVNEHGHLIKTSDGHGRSIVDDAAKAHVYRQVAKKSGTQALTNKELQDLVNRMNLEQQYTRLTGESGSPRSQQMAKKFASNGGKFVTQVLLGVGQQQAKDVLNQHAADFLIKQGIKAAKGK